MSGLISDIVKSWDFVFLVEGAGFLILLYCRRL